MTLALTDFLEQVDSVSPSSAGASVDGGKSVRTWILEHPDFSDIQTAITMILGTTNYAVGDGRLNRTPPLADPYFSYWYASSITNIRGVGSYTRLNTWPLLEVPAFPQFAKYEDYYITVESTPRPYPVVPDTSIVKTQGSWYNDSGTQQTFSYANEWARFCDFDLVPQNDSITAQQGAMSFLTQSGSAPNQHVYTGMPRMFLPNQVLRFVWYQVPYRYVTSSNSYITRWRGRVNQNSWNGYPAGSLLYLGYNVKKYTRRYRAFPSSRTGSSGLTLMRSCAT